MADPVVGPRPAPWSVPVVLHDPDPTWSTTFAANATDIDEVLGPVALAVDHVGSTSVPGLVAKPVIDILLQVPSSADEDAYVPALAPLGYRLQIREPDWFEHRVLYLRVDRGDDHDVNLHVLSPALAADEIGRMLRMRDWLRLNPQDRDLYAAVKRDLATRRWRQVQDYADAKSEVIEAILARAAHPST